MKDQHFNGAKPQEQAQEDVLSSCGFLKELASARKVCIIKTAVILAVFAAACVFLTKSFWVSLIFLAIYLIIRKFVQVGASMTHEYFNSFTMRYEIGDHSVLGFLVGLVAIYALMLGIQKLDALLFPPYFFIFEVLFVAGVAFWLLGPIMADIYFIIESSVMLKNPPQTEYFTLSAYLDNGNVGKFKRAVKKTVTTLVLLVTVGTLVGQAAQYFVESPKLLAELNRQTVLENYGQNKRLVVIPDDAFENPESRSYGRFKSRCEDEYVFESDNGGVKSKNTVNVTYIYENDGWVVSAYNAEVAVTEMNLHGEWNGRGRDIFVIENSDQFLFTVTLQKMTETEAVGKLVCKTPKGELYYESGFTATVEKKEETDKNGIRQLYFDAAATVEVPRGFIDTYDFAFRYHVGTDTVIMTSGYEAVLSRSDK